MDLTIRPAQPSDAKQISLLTAQLGYARTEEETLESLQKLQIGGQDLVLVAQDATEVLAWMQVTDIHRLESGRFGEIAGLVTAGHSRGRGIGRALVAAAIAWCRDRNIPVLKVRSRTSRERAHHFYRKAGFTERKEQKVFELPVNASPLPLDPA